MSILLVNLRKSKQMVRYSNEYEETRLTPWWNKTQYYKTIEMNNWRTTVEYRKADNWGFGKKRLHKLDGAAVFVYNHNSQLPEEDYDDHFYFFVEGHEMSEVEFKLVQLEL